MILDAIVEQKTKEIKALKENYDIQYLRQAVKLMTPTRSLKSALSGKIKTKLLAEVKKGSPSKGVFLDNFEPSKIAEIYTNNGAAGISVLTDEKFFFGRPCYLHEIRQVTPLPLLRKDFIIDPYQVYQSRLLGADAILLICAILTKDLLSELMETAHLMDLETLVEISNECELNMAIEVKADFIGINNRNLRTFQTDLNNTYRLYNKLPDTPKTVVSESGISNPEHMHNLFKWGIDAALVGEALVSSEDIASKTRELSGQNGGCYAKKICPG